MDDATKLRLRPILANSKRGRANTKADDAFAEKCWKKWPEEYAALRKQVALEAGRELNPYFDPEGNGGVSENG